MDFENKVAIVTGGASGVGEAVVRSLAAAGAKVVIADLNEAGAKSVADSIVAGGGQALAVAFDTSNEAQVAAGIETAVRAFGKIDILHNNAAITSVAFMMRDGMIHDMDINLWDQTMAVNLRGYMLCTKHVLPHMLAGGGGVIINTASGAGMQAEVVRAAYGTSKAAIIGFTRNVATQYGKMGIRCVAVVPGLIMTPTVAAYMPAPMIAMMKRHHLTPEIAGPQDIANAIVFLASDRAAFITGIAVPVDGGFSIHSPSYADEQVMYAAMSGATTAAVINTFKNVLALRGSATLGAEENALLQAAFTNGIVWHGAGTGAGGAAWGMDEVAKRWNAFASQATVAEVVADETHVVGIVEVSPPGGGPAIRQAHLFHLDGQGKASAVWSLPSDAAIQEAFESGQAVREHPNLAKFRAAEEARARNVFDAADLDIIGHFLREDVHWRSPWGVGPSSRDEVIAQFRSFKEATGGTMQLTLNEVFADDTHALSLVRLTAGRPGSDKRMDVGEANVFHLDAEGRTYEFWGVADDQASINNFWT